MDTECLANYWQIGFRSVGTGKVVQFELYDGHPLNVRALRTLALNYTIVTFNGAHYDLPMWTLAMAGANCAELKAASDRIINENLKSWQFENVFGVKISNKIDHIDLIEVAPGQASLKLYGGRLHSMRLQDMPLDHDHVVRGPEDRQIILSYNANDLVTTEDLFKTLGPQLALRESMSVEYDQDLRSKSDAQIAEAVIKSKVSTLLGTKVYRPDVPPGTKFRYYPPRFINFQSQIMRNKLREICDSEFVVAPSGKIIEPPALADSDVQIGAGVYRMGIGGLHSSEECKAHVADADTILVDRDVASYYPAIILNCELYPKHLGKQFLYVYKDIVAKRLLAKRTGNKVAADSLKITINGSFGKLGSKWSALYSPDLLVQTTVTGQLALLMLIEALEIEGIPVVSANTDGIVIKCPRSRIADMDRIVWFWELCTAFETEATQYRALYSRDVNAYIALKEKGGTKTKGAYADPGLAKNPQNLICVEAVCEFLDKGTPIEQTIRACTDIRKFVTVRRVTGGGRLSTPTGEKHYLGKVVRWYYAKGSFSGIEYVKPNKTGNHNAVARSYGCQPLMDLPTTFPSDVNHDWYIGESKEILMDIGHTPRPPKEKARRKKEIADE